MSAVEAIQRVLSDRIGLDPATVGPGLIARAAHARMGALHLESEEDYLRLLANSAAERDELVEEVVIPESWFYRDERPFSLLQDYVRARWLADSGRPPLRVLSLPCASGEEPYSVAIALQELGLPAHRCEILGVDVSSRSLAKARAGTFGPGSLRGLSPHIQARFFRSEARISVLAESVRSMVRFHRGNILDQNLLAGEGPFDTIFCRNLLIYLDQESRQRASATLDRLLAPDGILFLGHTERLELSADAFEAFGDAGSFALRRKTKRPTRLASKSPRFSPERARARTVREGRPKVHPLKPPARKELPQPLTTDIATEPLSTLLEEAAALADQGKTQEAAECCERHLREAGPNASGYFLLGMIRQASGASGEAEGLFQKTVYLDPQHDEALLALALMADRRGDRTAAEGYRRRAERVLRRRTP